MDLFDDMFWFIRIWDKCSKENYPKILTFTIRNYFPGDHVTIERHM